MHGINFDDGEGVVGNAEVEFIIQCSIDDAKKVCPPGLYP